MARVIPLTDTKVKSAKPKAKEYNLADGEGLMLRILPSGSKRWYFNYLRPFTKKRNAISLGSYPELTIKKARLLRAEYREMLANDVDPKVYLDEIKRQKTKEHLNTFNNIAKQWLESRTNNSSNSSQNTLTDKYAGEIWRSLENYVFPNIGEQPITHIKRFHLTQMLKPLETSGKLEATKRVAKRVEWVFEYAYNHGLIPENTAANLYRAFATSRKKHFPTIAPNDIPELIKSIENASIHPQTRLLVEWQLHTMTRPAEASGAKWSEIDFENKLWTIPSSRMKKRSKHVVPLTDCTLKILEKMEPLSSHREYIFPNRNNPRKPMNSQTVNMALKRMGYNKKLVAHGLRSLASTTLNEMEFNRDVIEAALAHGDRNIIRGTYNRTTYLEQRKELMKWWSNHLSGNN